MHYAKHPFISESSSKGDTHSNDVEVISKLCVCEVVSYYLKNTKIPDVLKNEAQAISHALQLVIESDQTEIMGVLNAVSVLDQVTPEEMGKEKWKM